MSAEYRIICKHQKYDDDDVLLIGYTEEEAIKAGEDLEEMGNEVVIVEEPDRS